MIGLGGNMAELIEINRKRVFTVTSANELLPLIRKITSEYASSVQILIQRFEELKRLGRPGAEALEEQINGLVNEWQSKMDRLGIRTKGLWIADFDSGDGFLCWKYPEERVGFWHAYQDGFKGRIPVEQRAEVAPSDLGV